MAQNTSTTDEGVEINGVIWATRNVGAPNTFVDNPEDKGMFYRWGNKKAWSATGTYSEWIEAGAFIRYREWEIDNDPSPAGWRLPTLDEIQKLLDTDKVDTEVLNENGLRGRTFTDNTNGNSIYFPAAGFRHFVDGSLCAASVFVGNYWSSSPAEDGDRYIAYFLSFCNNDVGYQYQSVGAGYSIRCVKENNIPTSVNNISSEKEKTVLSYYNLF